MATIRASGVRARKQLEKLPQLQAKVQEARDKHEQKHNTDLIVELGAKEESLLKLGIEQEQARHAYAELHSQVRQAVTTGRQLSGPDGTEEARQATDAGALIEQGNSASCSGGEHSPLAGDRARTASPGRAPLTGNELRQAAMAPVVALQQLEQAVKQNQALQEMRAQKAVAAHLQRREVQRQRRLSSAAARATSPNKQHQQQQQQQQLDKADQLLDKISLTSVQGEVQAALLLHAAAGSIWGADVAAGSMVQVSQRSAGQEAGTSAAGEQADNAHIGTQQQGEQGPLQEVEQQHQDKQNDSDEQAEEQEGQEQLSASLLGSLAARFQEGGTQHRKRMPSLRVMQQRLQDLEEEERQAAREKEHLRQRQQLADVQADAAAAIAGNSRLCPFAGSAGMAPCPPICSGSHVARHAGALLAAMQGGRCESMGTYKVQHGLDSSAKSRRMLKEAAAANHIIDSVERQLAPAAYASRTGSIVKGTSNDVSQAW